MESLGIEDPLLGWLKSCLSGRLQRVLLNGKGSQLNPVTAGVPQGSILGALLFLIFSNDIVDDLKSDPSLYADDTCLMKVITTATLSNHSCHYSIT